MGGGNEATKRRNSKGRGKQERTINFLYLRLAAAANRQVVERVAF